MSWAFLPPLADAYLRGAGRSGRTCDIVGDAEKIDQPVDRGKLAIRILHQSNLTARAGRCAHVSSIPQYVGSG
ncbi:hypothetical protein ABVV53_11480 [Novosphingobium sp. RD2P27]|uniref:Uncharacterized protein n=1 Tax=Novosphingobium kalidii TaxID=3230299 RepID=A0ABV2D2H4_9SPHN